jgi:two-component system phosphate regulon sensor histidine kinase PhoR
VVRYITPLRVQPECQQCHEAPSGSIIGAISADISLQEYESALRRRRDVLLLVLGGGLLTLGVLTFCALRRLVIRPLRTIERGTAAIARGDLDHRLHVHTGDEIETLAQEFNRMAHQLQESYGRVAEEQSKVLAAIEASQDAIWVSDANRRVVMVNSALEQHIGQRRDELLGQPCPNLLSLHNLDGPSICDAACPFLHPTHEGGRVEGCISSESGKEIWVEISYGRVTDLDGHLAGMIHIVRDLTQRKEIEQLKEDFISTVSHELRTPLNHIKGFATTLLQTDVEWDAATQRDFLGSISRESDRLTNLVDKILHLSRLEAEGLPMKKEEYQVNDLVDGALQRRRLLDGRQVDLCLAPDVPTLMVDGREIEVVLMNLIENAVRYSDPGTPITLSARRQANEVVFSVDDQGLGIPAEHLEHIFERFYRVDDGERRAPGGTGLGLAICKRIVEAHDGRIWVESTPGVGSTFHFGLPVDGEDGPAISPGLS